VTRVPIGASSQHAHGLGKTWRRDDGLQTGDGSGSKGGRRHVVLPLISSVRASMNQNVYACMHVCMYACECVCVYVYALSM
jgi:hypothetical protein